MTIVKNESIDEMAGIAGPVRANAMQYARGTLVLVAGTATQALPGFPATATPQVSRTVVGGGIGHLRVTYDGANLIVTSGDATETSTVHWLLID